MRWPISPGLAATREQYRAWMAEYDFLIKDAIEYSKSIRAEQK
jgi:hypothetical protein